MEKSAQGFTLVELIVVITIIAILSIIGLTIFTSVQKNARDAKRRADINDLAEAMEVNKTASGYVVLSISHFEGGAIPTQDPQLYPYCANSADDTIPDPPTAKWTKDSCGTNYTAVSGSKPAAGSIWRICTWLESGSAYCRSSRQ